MGDVLEFRGKQTPNQLTGIGPLNPALHWYGERVASVIEFSDCLFSVCGLSVLCLSVIFFLILMQYNKWPPEWAPKALAPKLVIYIVKNLSIFFLRVSL